MNPNMNSDPCALYDAMRLLGHEPASPGSYLPKDLSPWKPLPNVLEKWGPPPAEFADHWDDTVFPVGPYADWQDWWDRFVDDLQSEAWEVITRAQEAHKGQPFPDDLRVAIALSFGTVAFVPGQGVVRSPPMRALKCICMRRRKRKYRREEQR